MTMDERFDIAAEHMQRMSALAQAIEQALPILTDCLQRGPECAATMEQWQRMAEDMAQLRSLLQRQQHRVPVIGYADCTR